MKVRLSALVAVSLQTRSWVSKSESGRMAVIKFESWKGSPVSITGKLLEENDYSEIPISRKEKSGANEWKMY